MNTLLIMKNLQFFYYINSNKIGNSKKNCNAKKIIQYLLLLGIKIISLKKINYVSMIKIVDKGMVSYCYKIINFVLKILRLKKIK